MIVLSKDDHMEQELILDKIRGNHLEKSLNQYYRQQKTWRYCSIQWVSDTYMRKPDKYDSHGIILIVVILLCISHRIPLILVIRYRVHIIFFSWKTLSFTVYYYCLIIEFLDFKWIGSSDRTFILVFEMV